jgi:hypothetical protein
MGEVLGPSLRCDGDSVADQGDGAFGDGSSGCGVAGSLGQKRGRVMQKAESGGCGRRTGEEEVTAIKLHGFSLDEGSRRRRSPRKRERRLNAVRLVLILGAIGASAKPTISSEHDRMPAFLHPK